MHATIALDIHSWDTIAPGLVGSERGPVLSLVWRLEIVIFSPVSSITCTAGLGIRTSLRPRQTQHLPRCGILPILFNRGRLFCVTHCSSFFSRLYTTYSRLPVQQRVLLPSFVALRDGVARQRSPLPTSSPLILLRSWSISGLPETVPLLCAPLTGRGGKMVLLWRYNGVRRPRRET